MKITWNKNPLATTVELDEHEKKELWYKIKIEQMVEALFTVHYELTYKKDEPDMKHILEEVDPSYYLNDDERPPLDKRVDAMLEYYLEELKGQHVGDCTCVACSCSKCHAETLIGFDTLKPYPGKHTLAKIAGAFSRWNPTTQKHDGPDVSMQEALAKLRDYTPVKGPAWDNYSQADFDACVPRWTEEAKKAYEYLLAYNNQHFSIKGE